MIAEATPDELDALTVPPAAAVPELVRLWGQAAGDDRGCADLADLGLGCERGTGRWSDLRRFDRPAALKLDIDGQERYAVVAAVDDEFARLHRDDKVRRVPIAVLDERWSGDYLLLWQPPPGGVTIIGAGAWGEPVQWLRGRLARLPDSGIDAEGPARWDAPLTRAVRRFQTEHGLASDGIAGPRTLILLNNALADADVPRLSRSLSSPDSGAR
jgi:general secretion pathway protein A